MAPKMSTQFTGALKNTFGGNLKSDRFSAIPGLVVTSAISYTLLGLHATNWRGSENALNWTEQNHTFMAIFVQVLSALLGFLNVHAIGNVCKSSFLWFAGRNPFSLDIAHVISAISTPRMVWDLDRRFLCCLLAWNLAIHLPAAGWAACLTPQKSQQSAWRPLHIPTYEFITYNLTDLLDGSNIDKGNLSNTNSELPNMGRWSSPQGSFSFDPENIRKQLLDSASDASLVRVGHTEHAKLDRTGYAFVNRSNDVGSIAGFADFPATRQLWYQYTERAVSSSVSCFYNDSMDLYFDRIDTPQLTIPVYMVVDPLSPFTWGSFIQVSWLPDDLLTWRMRFNGPNKAFVNIVAAANGTNNVKDTYGYKDFNHMRCDITWDLVDYIVTVNDSSKLITNEPQNRGSLAWPEYGSTVAYHLFETTLHHMENDMYNSGGELGNALRLNLNAIHNATGIKSNKTTLEATEDFIARMLDQAALNLQMTRMVSQAPNATKPGIARVISPALVIGDFKFVVAIGVFNGLVCLLYVFVFWRCSGWSGMPPLDINNTSDIMIGAWRGAAIHDVEMVDPFAERGFDPSIRVLLKHDGCKAALVPLLSTNRKGAASMLLQKLSDGDIDEASDNNVAVEQELPQEPWTRPDET